MLGDPRVVAVPVLAPHDRADPGPPRRVTASGVVRLGLVVNVVMIPVVMPEGPGVRMRLAAPDPLAAIAPAGRMVLARLLAIAVLPGPRVMMIVTALPATMTRLLTRTRPPVSWIVQRGVN